MSLKTIIRIAVIHSVIVFTKNILLFLADTCFNIRKLYNAFDKIRIDFNYY